MIITQRCSGPTYGTDAVAASLRSVIAATPPAPRAAGEISREAAGGEPALDLAVLYPSLFQVSPPVPLDVRLTRGVAFRLSVLATALAMLLILHH